MGDPIVQEYERRYNVGRWITAGSMAVALPLHILTTYLIIRKSPSNFNAYKYVLLNVSFWAFLCDMTLDVVTLPMLTAEIFAVHAEGLIKGLGPRSGVVGTAVSSFCIAEILMALLIAFFYRYTALKMDFKVFGKTPKKWHYFLCTTLLMVVLPAFVASQVIFAYISEDELKAYTQKVHPELLPLLGRLPIFGLSKNGFFRTCVTAFVYAFLCTMAIYCFVRGIIAQFKSNRSMLSEQTYRQHVQLLKALVVQTMSPLILLTIPLFVLFGGLICGLNMMNEMAMVTEVSLSMHSTVNSLAVILLITPYRNAVLQWLRKTKIAAVSSIHKYDNTP